MITPEDVRNLPNFYTTLTDLQLQTLIDEAYMDVDIQYTGGNLVYRDRLAKYLVAHLASATQRKVQKKKASDLEMTYQSDSGSSTPFLDEFNRLLALFGDTAASRLNLMVL